MSSSDETIRLDDLSDEERQAVEEMRSAWKDLANSMKAQPAVFDIDDETGKQKTVWLGEWVSGPDCHKKAEAISKAKMEEYNRIGSEAFTDSLPLDQASQPDDPSDFKSL